MFRLEWWNYWNLDRNNSPESRNLKASISLEIGFLLNADENDITSKVEELRKHLWVTDHTTFNHHFNNLISIIIWTIEYAQDVQKDNNLYKDYRPILMEANQVLSRFNYIYTQIISRINTPEKKRIFLEQLLYQRKNLEAKLLPYDYISRAYNATLNHAERYWLAA